MNYQPEVWAVRKDTVYAAIDAVKAGMEYATECLSQHDVSLGRTTLKNRVWAERMEFDIRQMRHALKLLREFGGEGIQET